MSKSPRARSSATSRNSTPSPATVTAAGAQRHQPGGDADAERGGDGGHQYPHHPGAADQDDEDRAADERHHDADLQLAGAHDDPADDVGEHDEQAAEQRGVRDDPAVVDAGEVTGRRGGRPGRRTRSARRPRSPRRSSSMTAATPMTLCRIGCMPSEAATSSPSWSRLRPGALIAASSRPASEERQHLPEHVDAAAGRPSRPPRSGSRRGSPVAQHDRLGERVEQRGDGRAGEDQRDRVRARRGWSRSRTPRPRRGRHRPGRTRRSRSGR